MENEPNFLNNQPNAVPPHKSPAHWSYAVLAIIAVVGYFMFSYFFALWPFGDLFPAVEAPTPTPTNALDLTGTENWKTYRNDEYGFEFKYPNGWESPRTEISSPLNGYKFNHPSSNTSFNYDVRTNTWTPGENSPVLKATGDIQWFQVAITSSVTYVSIIPDPRSNIMIRITSDNERDLVKIISTFGYIR